MNMTRADRAARAPQMADVFEVHLRFARRMSERTGAPLGEAVRRWTPIHRRLGLGIPGDAPSDGWTPHAQALDIAKDLADQLAVVTAAWITAGTEPQPLPGQSGFGCFAHEPPKADGTVKIHFYNADTDTRGGPLARVKQDRRRADLTALTRNITRRHPEARCIAGRSWLYNLEAYRRLFPADYVATRGPATPPLHLTGTSVWGQLIDAHDRVRPEIREAVLAALPALDPHAPWTAFPLQPLEVQAPLASFQAAFGVPADATES